jgi:hypothetical protein
VPGALTMVCEFYFFFFFGSATQATPPAPSFCFPKIQLCLLDTCCGPSTIALDLGYQ